MSIRSEDQRLMLKSLATEFIKRTKHFSQLDQVLTATRVIATVPKEMATLTAEPPVEVTNGKFDANSSREVA